MRTSTRYEDIDMTLNEVYVYLKRNGLPVTFHDDDTRIRLEGSTAALKNILFLSVYKPQNDTYTVASSPSIALDRATYRDLDILVDSYADALIEHCDLDRVKRVRTARLRYAKSLHEVDRRSV